MGKFKVVSLDMFQTLVNVESRVQHIWKPILADRFTPERAVENARLLLSRFLVHWAERREAGSFCLLKDVYERSFVDVFEHAQVSYDVSEASTILFREQAQSEFYEDTLTFLDHVTKKYCVCIVSDADDAMVPSFHQDYKIQLFTSERHRSYKNDENNTMFKEMLRHYAVDASQVIHIGDSVSDVAGAKRQGLAACWLNRDGRTWSHESKPDYIVESLHELRDIL
ncbi:HAD family hydrolase [Gorillibacterium sp. CAU 1737]|uniref:HAD family hydrolase n=1 Tax=Gorillibacterium sp. CAU 1737 TaxID=3140362 RepID=UPI00326038B9